MCTLALLGCWRSNCIDQAAAQDVQGNGASASYFDDSPASWSGGPYEHTAARRAATEFGTWDGAGMPAYPYPVAQAMPVEGAWIGPPTLQPQYTDSGVYFAEEGWGEPLVADPYPGLSSVWCWQVLPDGLIYRSYQAGVHEPRLSLVAFHEASGGRALWDGTLGGRVGIVRYGTVGPVFPQGWQLDVEAAAIIRLTLDELRDFETADYRVGVPLTYGIDNWQFKLAVYHLSSHLGDEFALTHPGSLLERINYVRDAIVLGASYYPHPAWRLYAEAGYSFNADDGAEPWELQFGTELSRPGPTGVHGTPFVALNGHLRQEHDFGGDITAQAGWLWRGRSGQVTRAGLHYFNGKSSQYQTFDHFEQQIGFGLWYDF